MFKKGKCVGFYTINGKIKVKINEDETKIISHNVDLVEQFGEETMKAIDEERNTRS